MKKLKISAVIPTFNSAEYLSNAIKSILDQTNTVDEIIVVDDGSNDGTKNVVSQFGKRVIYIYQENSGPSAARNIGIHTAKNDWIAFLDADDQWVSDKIEKQIKMLSQNPDTVLFAGDMREVDPHLNILTPSVLEKHNLRSYFHSKSVFTSFEATSLLLNKNFIPTGTVLVRKDILRSLGGFNTAIRYGEDLELWLKISMLYSIACSPDIMMLRTKHDKNATLFTENMLKDLVHVMISINQWMNNSADVKVKTNINYYISNAWENLGYYYFSNNLLKHARQCYGESFSTNPSFNVFIHYIASLMPAHLIKFFKSIKNKL